MATPMTPARPPFPPFTRDSAMQKVRLAEDAWNTRDPAKVALAYAIDSRWRNRSEFIDGRNEIIAFLSRKWAKELDYRTLQVKQLERKEEMKHIHRTLSTSSNGRPR